MASNTRAPKLPSTLRPLFLASFMCAEERMGRKEGREGGRQTGRLGCGMEDRPAYPHFCPLPLLESGSRPPSPKCSLAWLLRVGSRPQWEAPAQGGRCE